MYGLYVLSHSSHSRDVDGKSSVVFYEDSISCLDSFLSICRGCCASLLYRAVAIVDYDTESIAILKIFDSHLTDLSFFDILLDSAPSIAVAFAKYRGYHISPLFDTQAQCSEYIKNNKVGEKNG